MSNIRISELPNDRYSAKMRIDWNLVEMFKEVRSYIPDATIRRLRDWQLDHTSVSTVIEPNNK